jgi:hypothetical protein
MKIQPDNLESHRDAWQSALQRLIELEADADDRLHHEHELKAMRDMYADLDRIAKLPVEKIAPVQGYAPGIPWSMHLEAYDSYCKQYGEQKALVDLEGCNCRGGFATEELDHFIPGWRDRVSEIGKLKARIVELEKALEPFAQFIEDTHPIWADERRIASLDYDFSKLTLGIFRRARTTFSRRAVQP